MKKSEINRRQEKVSTLLSRGKSETQIAKEIGVDRSTIVRDVTDLKEQSQNWLDSLPKGVFVFEYKLALDKIKQSGVELSNLLEESTEISEKLQILKAKDENTKLYIQLLAEASTIYTFKKAAKNVKGSEDVSQPQKIS